jgi:hypothetical protein
MLAHKLWSFMLAHKLWSFMLAHKLWSFMLAYKLNGIDAGYLHPILREEGIFYDANMIAQIAKDCCVADEELHKILYYDCEKFILQPEENQSACLFGVKLFYK